MKFFKQNGISFSMYAGRLRVEGLRSLPDPQAEKIRQQIRENKTDIIQRIYQQQHDDLWLQADELADWIDDSNSTLPWQERAAKVPELQAMSLELSRLEQLGAIPPGTESIINKAKKQDQNFLTGFSPLKIPKMEQASLGACPARCKRSGK